MKDCKVPADGTRSPRHFAKAIIDLDERAKASSSAWVKADCLNSMEAIEKFQAAYNRCFSASSTAGSHLAKSGITDWPTTISVSFDLTLHCRRRPPDKFGAVQFVFSKGGEDEETCRTVRKYCWPDLYFCQRNLKGFELPTRRCAAVDVFGYRVPLSRHVHEEAAPC